MKFAPYIDSWSESAHVPMGSAFHCVPQVHALYFGPAECGRHLFASFGDDAHASFLVVSDAQMAAGKSEDLVLDAVGELLERDPATRAFILCTGCQTAFIAIDGDDLARRVQQRHGVGCVYLSVNRMAAENTPGRGRVNVPGGDRFRTRRTLMRLVAQGMDGEAGGAAGARTNGEGGGGARSGRGRRRAGAQAGGLLFLSDTAFAPDNEALRLATAPAADVAGDTARSGTAGGAASNATSGAPASWVKTSAEWESFDDFLATRDAAVVVSTAPVWDESARALHDALGIPALSLPVSYMPDEVDAAYRALSEALGRDLTPLVADAREQALCAFEKAVADAAGLPLELDMRGAARPFTLAAALADAGLEIARLTLDGHALRYREDNDRASYERMHRAFPELVEDCERRAREHDHPHGASLLVAQGRWEKATRMQAAPARREGAYWGWGALAHLAALLSAAAKEARA